MLKRELIQLCDRAQEDEKQNAKRVALNQRAVNYCITTGELEALFSDKTRQNMKITELQLTSHGQMLEAAQKEYSELSAFLTCRQVAKYLCLSSTTIQKMVNNNSLQAWKTPGGHRRIALASVLNYQKSPPASQQTYVPSKSLCKVSMVIESPQLNKQLAKEVTQWQSPFKVSIFQSLPEALLELIDQKHDLFILQMNSPRQQQEKMLEIIQKVMNFQQKLTHSLILTSETDLLPPIMHRSNAGGIQVINNDVSPKWLLAYLAGFFAQRLN